MTGEALKPSLHALYVVMSFKKATTTFATTATLHVMNTGDAPTTIVIYNFQCAITNKTQSSLIIYKTTTVI